MADAGVGTGATITLGTSTYDVNIESISQGDSSVPIIDTTHLGTTGARTKIFGELIDWASIDVTAQLDTALLDSMKTALGVSQSVTITFPPKSGETAGATAAFTGGIASHNWSVPLEDKMMVGFTIAVLGDITFTDGS